MHVLRKPMARKTIRNRNGGQVLRTEESHKARIFKTFKQGIKVMAPHTHSDVMYVTRALYLLALCVRDHDSEGRFVKVDKSHFTSQ